MKIPEWIFRKQKQNWQNEIVDVSLSSARTGKFRELSLEDRGGRIEERRGGKGIFYIPQSPNRCVYER